MKNPQSAEPLLDYDSLLLGVCKTFHFSPKPYSVLKGIQQIYGKKPLINDRYWFNDRYTSYN